MIGGEPARFSVRRYTPDDAPAWNRAVAASPVATFLHGRNYLDYHQDRFTDHSLIVTDAAASNDADAPAALVPAHEGEHAQYGRALISHRGLTFGGLLTRPGLGVGETTALVGVLCAYLADAGFAGLWLRPPPFIYHERPTHADLYALAAHGAVLASRHMLLAAEPGRLGERFGRQRERGLKRAARAGVRVREVYTEAEWAAFWAVNIANLQSRYGADPVHRFGEMWRLHTHFPAHIRLFVADAAASSEAAASSGTVAPLETAASGEAGASAEPLAGVLMYETPRCAKSQYIASSAAGRDVGALDAVFAHLLRRVYAGHPWFDFGTSHTGETLGDHEGGTLGLNPGLVAQKEGFGALPIMMDSYWLPRA